MEHNLRVIFNQLKSNFILAKDKVSFLLIFISVQRLIYLAHSCRNIVIKECYKKV